MRLFKSRRSSSGQNQATRIHRSACEALEPRQLLTAVTLAPIAPRLANLSGPDTIDLATHFIDDQAPDLGTIAQLQISAGLKGAPVFIHGNINIDLSDNATPNTVANFLKYVNGGNFNNTFFSRSVPGFVEQLGAVSVSDPLGHISTFGTIASEFSPSRSNVRGTVAMALSGTTNDTAASDFFINLADNSSNLDFQNGGFTVFGHVIGNGMGLVDQIAQLPIGDLGHILDSSKPPKTFGNVTDVPFANYDVNKNPPDKLQVSNLVVVNKAISIPSIRYDVTSLNPDLVKVAITGTTLSLSYTPGMTGSATIVVNATSFDGTSVNQSFLVTVPDPNNPTAGPTAVDDTVPNIIQNTSNVQIRPLNNDTDSTAPLSRGGIDILTPPAHGQATIDANSGFVNYVPAKDYIGPDSITYAVRNINNVASNAATIHLNIVPPPASVTLGPTGDHDLTYTEPDGTVGHISITGGKAVITFTDFNVQITRTAALHGHAIASGVSANITDIVITDTGKQKATLKITAAGGPDGVVTIGKIENSTGGPISALIAPTAALIGDLQLNGVAKLILGSTNHSTMQIGSGLPLTSLISIGTATDTSINDAASILILRSGAWANTDNQTHAITAPSIFKLLNTGSFDEGLSLTDTNISLVTARIGGDLKGGAWQISGNVLNISARSTAPAWSLNVGALAQTLRFSGSVDSSILTGAIGFLGIKGTLGTSTTNITLEALATFAKHVLRVGVIRVGGGITNTIIFSNGNVGSISAASITHSGIYAGVNGNVAGSLGLPAAPTDLVAPTAFINSIHIGSTHKQVEFAETTIAAGNLKAANIGRVQTAGFVSQGNHIPFGVGAEIFGSLSATLDTGKSLALTHAQLKTAAALTAFETKTGITAADLADFKIVVVPKK